MSHDINQLPEWSQPWASRRLDQHTGAGHEVTVGQWTGLRDWLVALPTERPRMVGKLHKLSLAQALLASMRWHDDMAVRQARLAAQRAGFGGDPDAVEVVAGHTKDIEPAQQGVEPGWRWVRVTTPAGLDYEGAAMGHCVGRGSYDTATIYSLRDGDNMPHCTIEWDPDSRTVEQVQGRANGPIVERYHGAVVAFINALQPAYVEGAGKFEHVFTGNRLVHWRDLEDDMVIDGSLDISGLKSLTRLPKRLRVTGTLLAYDTGLLELPEGLWVGGTLHLGSCSDLTSIPPDVHVGTDLYLAWCTGLSTIPGNLDVGRDISLYGCTGLQSLPTGFKVARTIDLEGCTELVCLPDGLDVKNLDITRCYSLQRLPPNLYVSRNLIARDCTALVELPSCLHVGGDFDIRGCTGVTSLPHDAQICGDFITDDIIHKCTTKRPW